MTRRHPPMWLTLVVAIAGLLLVPRTTTGAEFVWSDSLDAYKDVACGTSEQDFKVDLYRYANLSGPRTRVCSSVFNLCNAPMEGTAGCSLLFGNQSANDKPSSVDVIDLPAGRCIVLYKDSGYQGTWVTYSEGPKSQLPASLDNAVSSLRLGC